MRVQALFRGWKVRKALAASGEKDPIRHLRDKQRFYLKIEAISGANMPSVNTFGGCDPFVEFRAARGKNPENMGSEAVAHKPEPDFTAETEAKQNDLAPQWEGSLDLSKVYNAEDQYLQVVLWDYNMTGNTAVGNAVLPIDKAIEGLVFNALDEPVKKVHSLKLRNLLPDSTKKVKAPVVKFSVSYVEALSFKVAIKSGSKLPKVDMLGSCDAFIELRAVRDGQLQKAAFEYHPGPKCLWSAKTSVVNNSTDPKWNENFEMVLPGDPTMKLQMILWDSNSPMPDMALAHAIIDLKQVAALKQGGKEVVHKLKFSKLVGVDCPNEIKKSSLKIAITSALTFED